MNRSILIFTALIAFASCKKAESAKDSLITIIKQDSLMALTEADYRPAYHFSPARNWMNDPNGLVYYKGKYHLFYQYHPYGNTWGPMHWGHATSTDLFNWQDLPIAIAPDNTGTIFSGSAVADVSNTSGFKTGTEDPLVATYTLAGSQQHQAVAYSNDGGLSWLKYTANPVLPNPGIADFRDPKVFWNAARQKWYMVLAAGNKVNIYSSSNLKSWSFESSFGETQGAHGGVWECPDLFELPVEGTNSSKWVLLVSINPGGPNGGSATQYFVGDFDGKNFTALNNDIAWLDYGTDSYAGVTFNNIPAGDGRRILVGWMSNWTYAERVPTTSWRGAMTTPRILSLKASGQNFILTSKPAEELTNYKANAEEIAIENPTATIDLKDNKIVKSGSYELNFKVDLSLLTSSKITIGNSIEKLVITINKAGRVIEIDRTNSGKTDFVSSFGRKITCPFTVKGTGQAEIQLLVDKTSVELFADGGEKVITALFFPNYQYNYIKLEGNGSNTVFSNFKVKGISKSILR